MRRRDSPPPLIWKKALPRQSPSRLCLQHESQEAFAPDFQADHRGIVCVPAPAQNQSQHLFPNNEYIPDNSQAHLLNFVYPPL